MIIQKKLLLIFLVKGAASIAVTHRQIARIISDSTWTQFWLHSVTVENSDPSQASPPGVALH